MVAVGVEAFLKDISAENPCGNNLEYDADYLELMRVAQGTPERQMGSTVIPAEEPNWREVRDRCAKILGRTKDLNVAIKMCEALLRLEGLPGLCTGLGVIGGLVDQRWDGVHPRLDPDDGNDPTARITILGSLTDPAQFVSRVRALPLTNSLAGKFGLREIGWAKGHGSPPAGTEAPKPEMIEAAFHDTPQDELRSTLRAAEETIGVLKAMDARLTAHVGVGQGIDFDPILKVLGEVAMEARDHLPAEPGSAADPAVAGGNGRGGVPLPGRPLTGDIRSLDDVRSAIDRICKYYEQVEPSSPIPLLLRRAERLVGKSFLEIMKDVSPDGVKQVESLAGIETQSS